MRRPIPIQYPKLTLIRNMIVHPRCLTRSRFTPALSSNIRSPSYTNAPRALVAAWAPCPACAPADGEVVPAEAEPRTCHTYQRTEQHVEAEVSEIREARAGDVYRCADGHEDED